MKRKGTSRFPGFYKMTLAERRSVLARSTGIPVAEIEAAVDTGGMAPETADKVVENVLGTYALPFGVALNVVVNGREHLAPMVVEEPSVIAAASNAAKMVREGGGFEADADASIMTSQVQVYGVADLHAGAGRITAARAGLLDRANAVVRGLVERGGGARDLEVRFVGDDMLVVHVYVDCRDAMGANLVNTIAEAVGDEIAALAGGTLGLRILSNLSDRRCVRVRCAIPAAALATRDASGDEVALGIANASRFAEGDPYRAATHNKGIMNGVDAVCIATGNDWRAVEAGAHAFAARSGRYSPLATWRIDDGDDGQKRLRGSLELPLALGTVGGTLRVHPAARLALKLLGSESAAEVAIVAACVGMASNLAALRALATDGIQRGHMALHARSVALAAGATGELVEKVAQRMVETREISLEGALRAVEELRG